MMWLHAEDGVFQLAPRISPKVATVGGWISSVFVYSYSDLSTFDLTTWNAFSCSTRACETPLALPHLNHLITNATFIPLCFCRNLSGTWIQRASSRTSCPTLWEHVSCASSLVTGTPVAGLASEWRCTAAPTVSITYTLELQPRCESTQPTDQTCVTPPGGIFFHVHIQLHSSSSLMWSNENSFLYIFNTLSADKHWKEQSKTDMMGNMCIKQNKRWKQQLMENAGESEFQKNGVIFTLEENKLKVFPPSCLEAVL